MFVPIARVSQFAILDGHSGSGAHFSPSYSVSPVSIIPPPLSILVYHVGYKQ
jgi:hypothetical protein